MQKLVNNLFEDKSLEENTNAMIAGVSNSTATATATATSGSEGEGEGESDSGSEMEGPSEF